MVDNNKIKTKTFINIFRSDRTAKTLLLAVILIVIMGLLRPKQTFGMYEKAFWVNKVSWNDYADVVVTGDSRVLLGISPEQIQLYFKDMRVVNYAFGVANIYTPEYVESIETVLKKNGDKKTIILGITPHSLTMDPDFTNQFLQLKNYSVRKALINRYFAAFFSFFEYMSFQDVMHGIFPKMAKSNTHRELFADGWLAYSKKPPGKKKELGNYLKIYDRCKVAQKMTDNLLRHVSDWNGKKIKVYGFLVPTCREMVKLEEEISGFNLTEFKIAFEYSGGTWIEIEPTAYDSFDGSHLQRESAIELSRNLASIIYEIEQKR